MAHENSQRAANFIPDNITSGNVKVGQGSPQSELGLQFYNGLSKPITVVTRAGVQITIPPIHGSRLRGFVIRSLYNFGYGVIVDTHGLLNDQGRTTSKEAQVLEHSLFQDSDSRHNRYTRTPSVVDYLITREQFEQNGGSLYLSNLDLTLSALNPHYVPKHPYSVGGQRELLEDNDPALTEQHGLSFKILIVDEHGRYGARFINIGGEVYLIKSVTGSSFNDGVYLTSAVPANGETDFVLPRSEYYTFEEADKQLPLYTTYNDAKTLGNPENVFKRELEQRAHDLRMAEIQAKQDKTAHEARVDAQRREFEVSREAAKQKLQIREDQLHERELEMTRLEGDYSHRDALLKRDALLLKEVFDERNHGRREVIEILKHIPVLVSGVVGIYLAIKKIKG